MFGSGSRKQGFVWVLPPSGQQPERRQGHVPVELGGRVQQITGLLENSLHGDVCLVLLVWNVGGRAFDVSREAGKNRPALSAGN